MTSKFRCDCGASVRTNLFEGHGVYVLVAEKHVEEDRSDDDANACLDRIVWALTTQRSPRRMP